MEDSEAIPSENYSDAPAGPEKEFLPSSLAALILGIASLVNMSFLGWIPAIIGLAQANNALRLIEENPEPYTESSINMAYAGKKMSMLGLIFGIIGMFVTAYYYYWIISTSLDSMRYF